MTGTTTDSERELWRVFIAMRRQLDRTLERRLQSDAGISTADFEILSALHNVRGGGIRAGQVAEIIGWEKSRVSHQIQRMEQRSLIVRWECGDDARGVWVALTADGERAFSQASGDRNDAVRQHFFDVLTDDEKTVLAEVSARVLTTLNDSTLECAEQLDRV